MSANTPKSVNGQLALATGTLYTCPGATAAGVIDIIIVNTDAGAQTLNIYRKKGGTSYRLIDKDYSLASKAKLSILDKITLEDGDLIQGDASVAAKLDYSISLIEKTVDASGAAIRDALAEAGFYAHSAALRG